MSLTRAALRLSKSSNTIQPGSIAALNAPFSQTARPLTDKNPEETSPKQSTSTSGEPNGRRDEKKNQGGSYTRVLTAFGVGIPLGWLVHTINARNRTADSADFIKYTLVDRTPISSTSSIFSLKPATGTVLEFDESITQHVITSVQFKQPQLQIARSYTLLPPVEGQDKDELRFLIRKEQKGEVSGYLHRLPLGSEIELRGPFADALLPERTQTVAFLAGGTGIVPALQVADKLAGHADVHVLWSNRKREDCIGGVSDTPPTTAKGWNISSWVKSSSPITTAISKDVNGSNNAVVDHLEKLKGVAQKSEPRKSALKVDYYVDEESTFVRPADVEKLLQSISQAHGSADRIIFVSGPEGFINYWAGPKQWVDGHEDQGPLRGILSTLNLQGWQVVKL
ncbi:Hypothetical protein R9X50_00168200 [Acrodontium crateriforme]|uniref:FAD-binding FR-type domain-containing protein n=1 Tax=Acrodontium crateriforme TaxID=150365 RepID=A0AAQ3M2G3_9PEZI|nr:Hypothetical protein R9X50_00168200 [Acrodontium crateriforme]